MSSLSRRVAQGRSEAEVTAMRGQHAAHHLPSIHAAKPSRSWREAILGALVHLDWGVFGLLAIVVIAGIALEDPEHEEAARPSLVFAIVLLVVRLILTALSFFLMARERTSALATAAGTDLLTLVVRDGQRQRVAAADLVQGDLVCLEPGFTVPADLHIFEEADLLLRFPGDGPEDEMREVTAAPATAQAPEAAVAPAGAQVLDGSAKGLVTCVGDDSSAAKRHARGEAVYATDGGDGANVIKRPLTQPYLVHFGAAITCITAALFIGVTLTAEPLLLSWVSTATLCISIACALSGAFSPVLKAAVAASMAVANKVGIAILRPSSLEAAGLTQCAVVTDDVMRDVHGDWDAAALRAINQVRHQGFCAVIFTMHGAAVAQDLAQQLGWPTHSSEDDVDEESAGGHTRMVARQQTRFEEAMEAAEAGQPLRGEDMDLGKDCVVRATRVSQYMFNRASHLAAKEGGVIFAGVAPSERLVILEALKSVFGGVVVVTDGSMNTALLRAVPLGVVPRLARSVDAASAADARLSTDDMIGLSDLLVAGLDLRFRIQRVAAWQCAAVFAVIVPVVVMACVLQMPVPLPAPLLLLNITIAVSPITVLIAILRPGRSNRGQHRSLSGRSTLTSWFSKSHQVLDDADGDTELTLVPRRGNAGSPTRDGSGLAVEHVETFPSPSFVKPQRFVVPRRLLAFGTFWLGTLQIAALCSAMLVVLALHGFPFDRAFRGQRFDNWGKQIFMCRGSDGPPDPADFVNIDGARFQVPANLTDKAAPTWKDAFRDGYIFWSPSTSVTGDASAVGDCTFPAKNYRGERDKMTSKFDPREPETYAFYTAEQAVPSESSYLALMAADYFEFTPYRSVVQDVFKSEWTRWPINDTSLRGIPPATMTEKEARLAFRFQPLMLYRVETQSASEDGEKALAQKQAQEIMEANEQYGNALYTRADPTEEVLVPGSGMGSENGFINVASRMTQFVAMARARGAGFTALLTTQWQVAVVLAMYRQRSNRPVWVTALLLASPLVLGPLVGYLISISFGPVVQIARLGITEVVLGLPFAAIIIVGAVVARCLKQG